MSGFVNLWERSLKLVDAEEAQRFVRGHFEGVCRENQLRFWRCPDIGPIPTGRSLFVGVAEYDRTDLELLDSLCEQLKSATSKFDEIHVFCIFDCKHVAEILRVIPDVGRFPAQNPLVAVWLNDECLFTGGGWTAKQWLRSNVAG